jgi:hypothetical protein
MICGAEEDECAVKALNFKSSVVVPQVVRRGKELL